MYRRTFILTCNHPNPIILRPLSIFQQLVDVVLAHLSQRIQVPEMKQVEAPVDEAAELFLSFLFFEGHFVLLKYTRSFIIPRECFVK